MWIVCITSVRHVLTVNGYGGRQTKENEKSWCFKGWETLDKYYPPNLYMLINLGFFAKESHPKRNNEIFTAFYDLCQDRNVHYRWRIRYDTSH